MATCIDSTGAMPPRTALAQKPAELAEMAFEIESLCGDTLLLGHDLNHCVAFLDAVRAEAESYQDYMPAISHKWWARVQYLSSLLQGISDELVTASDQAGEMAGGIATRLREDVQ